MVAGQVGKGVSGHHPGGADRGQHGGEHGDAEGAPQLTLAVEQGRGLGRVDDRDGGERRGLGGHDHLGHAEPQVNMSSLAHHRSVPNPIWVISAVVRATPTSVIATRRGVRSAEEHPAGQLVTEHHADGLREGVEAGLEALSPRPSWKRRGATNSTPRNAAMATISTRLVDRKSRLPIERELRTGWGSAARPGRARPQHRPSERGSRGSPGCPTRGRGHR